MKGAASKNRKTYHTPDFITGRFDDRSLEQIYAFLTFGLKKGYQATWADFFVNNHAFGRVMEKCGFRDTGEVNWLSQLYRGDERPVKVMRGWIMCCEGKLQIHSAF